MIKVGDSAEIIRITGESPYPSLYKKGYSGFVKSSLYGGGLDVIIGNSTDCELGWHVPLGIFKKIGKLTITKVK